MRVRVRVSGDGVRVRVRVRVRVGVRVRVRVRVRVSKLEKNWCRRTVKIEGVRSNYSPVTTFMRIQKIAFTQIY